MSDENPALEAVKTRLEFCVSRRSSPSGGSVACLRIQDSRSRAILLEQEFSFEEFARMLLNEVTLPVRYATLRGLSVIGKLRVAQRRKVGRRGASACEEDAEEWLRKNCQEEGWHLNPALRSQNSVESHENGVIYNYEVFKFVDVDKERDDE